MEEHAAKVCSTLHLSSGPSFVAANIIENDSPQIAVGKNATGQDCFFVFIFNFANMRAHLNPNCLSLLLNSLNLLISLFS